MNALVTSWLIKLSSDHQELFLKQMYIITSVLVTFYNISAGTLHQHHTAIIYSSSFTFGRDVFLQPLLYLRTRGVHVLWHGRTNSMWRRGWEAAQPSPDGHTAKPIGHTPLSLNGEKQPLRCISHDLILHVTALVETRFPHKRTYLHCAEESLISGANPHHQAPEMPVPFSLQLCSSEF